MTFKNAQQSRVLAGSLDYSGYTTNISFGVEVDMLDVTTLVDTAKKFMPGMDGSNAAIDMILDTDTTAGGQWANITTWKSATAQALLYAPSGTAFGSECFLAGTLESSLAVTSQTSDKVMVTIAALTDGATDAGVILEPSTAVTVDGNGTARDNGAATANGGVAQIHVTAFSGLTSDVVTVEHSVDGATAWATLATFATVTGLTSERVVVAAGTTVRRYLRVVDDVTGTGTITRAVAFSRR